MKPGSFFKLDVRLLVVEVCEARNLTGEGKDGDNYAKITFLKKGEKDSTVEYTNMKLPQVLTLVQ